MSSTGMKWTGPKWGQMDKKDWEDLVVIITSLSALIAGVALTIALGIAVGGAILYGLYVLVA